MNMDRGSRKGCAR